ncbi:MAG: ferritin family protein [Clostridiales bacterium]|nr:ferritin family protein [Clostridiales bacterium]
MSLKELTVIKQAIINEIEGYEFYKLAAQQTQADEPKKAFEILAEEELMHVEWLKKIYSSLNSNTEDNLLLTFEVEVPTQKIFSWANVDRKSVSLAVSVFGIAIQMERESIKFYNSASQDTDDKNLKEFYNMLSLWEQKHLEQFADEYEKLKEEWWDKQGFEPM